MQYYNSFSGGPPSFNYFSVRETITSVINELAKTERYKFP